jgi:hypothetical protein
MNNLKSKFMAFKNIFKDNNDINEKSVIGFMSFLVMIMFLRWFVVLMIWTWKFVVH